MADKDTRGSARVLERLGIPDVIAEESLKGIIEVARRHDVEILDWCQFGQPGIDGVCGTFQVQPQQAGALIDELLKQPGWACKLEVFPLGMTDPTAIQVGLTGGVMAQ